MSDKPKMPKILDTQHEGDPFKTLFEFTGQHYVFNESELIASEEAMYRSFEMDMRLKAADGARSLGLPWR